jgi:16S rRNA (cytosine967-C5)-methyltransferase
MSEGARISAVKALIRIERDSAYSNLVLDSYLKNSNMSYSDCALFTALILGVLERKITLDYNLSLYLSKGIKKLKPEVLAILRVGAYQILFTDRIPDSAAVNESVKASLKLGCSYAAGVINAVLRRLSENSLRLPENTETLGGISIKYSVPEELALLLTESLGKEDAIGFLESSFGKPPTVIRVNTLKTDADNLIRILRDEGINAKENELVKNSLTLENAGDVANLKSFSAGLFHVQDISSQLCVKALAPEPGETVLDMCSSPGGKSFTAAQYMNGEGKLYSFDLTENRLGLIKGGAKRLEIGNLHCALNDASKYNKSIPLSSRVLCDVPCSGLGVLRKKPEIRFKAVSDIGKLYQLQYDILRTSSLYVKDKGTLIYSTCTVNPAENREIALRFLRENPDFSSEKVLPEIARNTQEGDFLTLLPHIHGCDGFFISKFIKG